MNFKENKANYVLAAIFLILFIIIICIEIVYKRSQRFNWDLAVLPTEGMISTVDYFYAYTDSDQFYDQETYYPHSNEESDIISTEQELFSSDESKVNRKYPNRLEIAWMSLFERAFWSAIIQLPKNYEKTHIGARYIIAQFHPKGLVTIYIGDVNNKTEVCSVQAKPDSSKGIIKFSELPLETQFDIALKIYNWDTLLSDERKDKKKSLEMSVSNYSPQYYYTDLKKPIPEDIRLTFSIPDSDYYATDITIKPEVNSMLKGLDYLNSLDSTAKSILHIIVLNEDSFKLELSDEKNKHKLSVPAKTETAH